MKIMNRNSMLSMCFWLLMVTVVTSAGVPQLVNIQGILTDDSGNPVPDAIHTVVFAIYNVETGGLPMWSETRAVAATDGLFSIMLGEVEPIPAALFAKPNLWLGMAIIGNPEMVPRQRLTTVPYGYHALNADSAGHALSIADNAVNSSKIANGSISFADLAQNGAVSGQIIKWNGSAWVAATDESGSGGGWVDDGSVVRLSSSSDLVGIGTSSPEEKLHVVGDIRLGAGNDVAFGNDSTRIYETGGDLVVTADDDLHLQPDDDIYIRADFGSAWVHFDNSLERLGVGTTNPAEKLEVNGDIRLGIDSDIAFGSDVTRIYGAAGDVSVTADDDIYLRPDDDIYVLADAGTNWIRFNTGYKRLGIGTTSPTHSLTLNGTFAMQTAGTTKYHLNYYNGGWNFSETNVADYRINIEDGGNVGIGTGNPTARLHVAGSAKINDTLTAGAIFSTSMADEAGLASDTRFGYLDLTTSWQTVASRSISVPGPGYIIAMASAKLSLYHNYTDDDYAYTAISDNSTSPETQNELYFYLRGNVGTGDYAIPFANTTVFEVESSGTHTYYYLAKKSAEPDSFIERVHFVLLYVPTAYGTVETPTANETAEHPLVSPEAHSSRQIDQSSRVDGGSMADVLAELASLRQELADLKQQVKSSEY